MARRAGNSRGRHKAAGISQLPWTQVSNPYAPVEVLSAEQVEVIHRASLRLLAEVGVRVLDDTARALFAGAGARVDEATQMVRLDPAMVMERIATAPSEFVLRARNPARDLHLGANRMAFAGVGGPAFVSDLDKGRRPGTYAEQCDYIRLIQALNIIHQEGGGPFEAMDLPAATRHLDLHLAQIRLTDKNWQGVALGRERTEDGINMACIALGTDRADLARRPAILGIINTNSPLQLDGPMAEGAMALAAAGQVACITPFTLAGSMSPVTLAGTLAQQNAEVLFGVALTQLVRPGAPVMYGSFTSNVDMKSGAPALGTPEYTKAALASGQLARHYRLPFRSSNTNSSNCNDAQAAYESGMSLWGAVNGHANLVNHAAGWLEGGLTASFEKLVLDAEMLQMMAEYLRPIEVNDETLALGAIADVGPGGHFFGAAHTMARYETAFYTPLVSDWQNFERWQETGGHDAATRANRIWKQLLADYEQPPLDAAINEQLEDYVARRKRGTQPGSA